MVHSNKHSLVFLLTLRADWRGGGGGVLASGINIHTKYPTKSNEIKTMCTNITHYYSSINE